MHARWAVACLLVFLVTTGCSTKQTVKPDAPPIKEMPIVEVPPQPELVSPPAAAMPVAPIKGTETAASVEPPAASETTSEPEPAR